MQTTSVAPPRVGDTVVIVNLIGETVLNGKTASVIQLDLEAGRAGCLIAGSDIRVRVKFENLRPQFLSLSWTLTCRVGVPEVPNAQELFWCWRIVTDQLRDNIESVVMDIATQFGAAHFTAICAKLRELQPSGDLRCGLCVGEDADGNDVEYDEDDEETWSVLTAEDEGKVAEALPSIIARLATVPRKIAQSEQRYHHAASGAPPPADVLIPPVTQSGEDATRLLELLQSVAVVVEVWQAITAVVCAPDVHAFRERFQSCYCSEPFTIAAMFFASTYANLFERIDTRTGRYQVRVCATDHDTILDQQPTAPWRADPFLRRWHGNALMHYPIRAISDRAHTALLGWMAAGTTPLEALKRDWLARPTTPVSMQ